MFTQAQLFKMLAELEEAKFEFSYIYKPKAGGLNLQLSDFANESVHTQDLQAAFVFNSVHLEYLSVKVTKITNPAAVSNEDMCIMYPNRLTQQQKLRNMKDNQHSKQRKNHKLNPQQKVTHIFSQIELQMNCEIWTKEDNIELFMIKEQSQNITSIGQIWLIMKSLLKTE